jgi:putative tricarboxylic transport membrane protein
MNNTTYSRRTTLKLLAAAGAVATAWPLQGFAQTGGWSPSENITYNIGLPPGGSVDLYARGIKAALESLNLVNGKTVVPDNKPGAAGLLALRVLQNNPGNGHQLATFHTGSIAGQVTGVLKADMRDFVPVAMMVEETTLVAVGADSPVKTANEMVERLKAQPASLKIGVAPLRGLNIHLAIVKPLRAAGVDVSQLTVVPFRSSAESMTALMGGHIDVVSATGPTVLPQVAAGKVRVLASAAPVRGTGPLASVPTWRELGVPADYVSYNGVLLAPGATADQIRFWEESLRKVSESAEWKALVERSGNRPMFKGFVESHRYLRSELESTQALVDALGAGAR